MKSDTLVIRHLPPNLSLSEKEQLLKHFGVKHIKILAGKLKKNNVVFARFESDTVAQAALQRLHQLDVMGYPLTVEYARGKATDRTVDPENEPAVSTTSKQDECQKPYEVFMKKLNSWNAPLNFHQPPPSHLKYHYPPPNRNVLANISSVLASVPKFYTQVLHLMNKMNLPSPFESSHPLFSSGFMQEQTFSQQSINNDNVLAENQECIEMEETTTEEESELESDPENNQRTDAIQPVKRTKPQIKKFAKKRKFLKPTKIAATVTKITKPEEVFDIVDCDLLQRRIELNIPVEAVASKRKSNVDTNDVEKSEGGFGLLFPPNEPNTSGNVESKDSDEEDDPTLGSTITSQQLAANRIPSKDQKHLPVYKNYQPGVPSCRLYIKNLAKQVVERDLHFIYRKYLIADYEEQGSMFDIRLMKDGRMKGQAFVTLQNTKQAQLALNETNGYILKDKPLVVQFARSAKATN